MLLAISPSISTTTSHSTSMRSAKRSSVSSASQLRSNSTRLNGRVTKEDIRAAGLRRWNGRARITTDWINLFQEPELCFPDGDVLVYLREPGQSSRGPAFRVHKLRLEERGFDFLLDRCVDQQPLHPGTECVMSPCHGCTKHLPPSELYIPAPSTSDLTVVFDHHATTRNFFAWLYDIPLAGRALGVSLVELKTRIDYYRPGNPDLSAAEVVAFAESQRYMDFRECLDHALAALLLAEHLEFEDLWIDAFAHCVGMSYRGIRKSLEYPAISYSTRVLISDAQLEMESRLERVRRSVSDFFESDVSGSFLALSQSTRDHLDRCRSWLHSYHIEQHGFWPPADFEQEAVQRNVYSVMYSDFKNLYHHLVDTDSSDTMADMTVSGGICTLQNIQAFDARHKYQGLPKQLPMLPQEPDLDTKSPGLQRRKSWNPMVRRRADRDKRRTLRTQAIIKASNRDWNIMSCPLVRRFSEYEAEVVVDDSENIPMADGRKVRWILVYAILQTLISVMQTPKQVRDVDGITYSLSCQPPTQMPWYQVMDVDPLSIAQKQRSVIEPDTHYLQSNLNSTDSLPKTVRTPSKKTKDARRQSLPVRMSSMISRPSTSSSSSFRRLVSRRNSLVDEAPPIPKAPAYCEIFVHGYGNGLNEVEKADSDTSRDEVESVPDEKTSSNVTLTTIKVQTENLEQNAGPQSPQSDNLPALTPTSSTSVSRESSNASANTTWSKVSSASHSDTDLTLKKPAQSEGCISLQDLSTMILTGAHDQDSTGRPPSTGFNRVFDEKGLIQTFHINTQEWDNFLGVVA